MPSQSNSSKSTGVRLNPSQKMAVEAPRQPLLIVAGAGTGKTQTLTQRLIYLLKAGISPQKIAAITFTNKAAEEMRRRILTHDEQPTTNDKGNPMVVGHKSLVISQPFIGTFHSFGARILRAEGHHLGRKPSFVIFDDDDAKRLIKKIINEASTDRLTLPICLNKIATIKNSLLSLSDLEPSSENELFKKIYLDYENALRRNNAFDFDDLIEKPVRIFKSHPAVLRKYQQFFPYLLIDEYQDINKAQYALIRLLAGQSGQISVVGDDQQAIYRWRGATFEIFLDFEKDWPKSQVILLEENYRSTANIIAAASAVIKNNQYQRPKKLWTKNPAGSLIKILETPDAEAEAEWIIKEIQNSPQQSRFHRDATGQANCKTQNLGVAILYRTNAQSRPIEQALIENEIPYQIFGGVKFYERKEIKDIMAVLRLVINPLDEISRERLKKLLLKQKFQRFEEFLKNKKTLSLSPPELISAFLQMSNYFDYLGKNFLNANERRENIEALLAFASEFEDLNALVEKVSLLQANDSITRINANADTNQRELKIPVQLMTIHLAKGLEFDHVFLIGCGEGLLPHNRSLTSQAELEEERRLMYVAMTRAKKELCLSFYDLASRFLYEIPAELTRFESLASDENQLLDDEERYISLD